MFKTRTSPLLPLDARGRPNALRAYFSSKRARAFIVLAFSLSAVVFFLGLSPETFVRIHEPSIHVDVDEEALEVTTLPPQPTESPLADSTTTISPEPQVVDNTWELRAEQVREAFIRGYSVYHEHAFPHDEVLPISYSYTDK